MLVELLVVMVIVTVVVGLMVPVLMAARRSAERVTCASELRGVGQAAHAYVTDGNARNVAGLNPYSHDSNRLWIRNQYVHYGQLLEQDYLLAAESLWCAWQNRSFTAQDPESGIEALGVQDTIVQTNYVMRGVRDVEASSGPETMHQMALVADMFYGKSNTHKLRNHQRGLNVLYADSSVAFQSAEHDWNLATSESWRDLDRGGRLK